MLASYLLDATRSAHPLEDTALEHLGYKALDRRGRLRHGRQGARSLAAAGRTTLLDFAGERADLRAAARADASAGRSRRERPRRGLRDARAAARAGAGRHRARRRPRRRRGLRSAVASDSSASSTELGAPIFELAGVEFNINSPKQLAEVLFDKLQLPVLKRTGKTRAASTAVEVLEELALTHELPRLILEWRGLQKLKGTYIDALPQLVNPDTGRVHTSFNQAVAATGRLSSSDPNLQNIPIRTELGREIRRAFIAEPGHVLISADYSQIELRVLAHLSGDETLIEAFQRGDDIHDQTALKVFGADSGARPARAAAAREDHQLRAALREDGVHAGQGHRRHAAGGAGVHRRLLRRLPARPRVHRPDARGGARAPAS